MNHSTLKARLKAGGLPAALALFTLVLIVLLGGVFSPGRTLFSNDGPLGELMTQSHQLPGRFLACWNDLNSIGFDGGAASPSISFALQWLLGPVFFSKLYAISSLLILGLGAWCFFYQCKLSAPACLLGGLAAMLNSTFFSVACWGVGAHDITAGMTFFALAALADPAAPRRWLRVALAGFALGMAVTEGADVGAILSLYVAAFVVYQIWTIEGPLIKKTASGLGRLALVATCAAVLAAQSLHGLIGTSIIGVKGAQQDAKTKADRWDWATQWSLPKLEAVNLVIPGIFGYRMDDLDSQAYWGKMGRAPALDKFIQNGRQGARPNGFIRYNGGGNYAGAFVVLLALLAAAESFRRTESAFTLRERKWLWFWLAVVVVSLLLALGRFAPFYKYVYALPYFSTIRNPTKFLYPFALGLAVLSAFGVHGLHRRYMERSAANAPSRWAGLGAWWSRAPRFEKGWVYLSGLVGLGLLLGWWQYAASRPDLINYLQGAEIGAAPEDVADFSIHHAGWLVAVFFLGTGLLILTFSRAFYGSGAKAGVICLGLLLAGDLGLADRPWVHYWNYEDKYASNSILEILRDKPYEHRVSDVPLDSSKSFGPFFKLYKFEWAQHLFPYYNIQTFETVEMSRMPLDFAAFTAAVNNTNGTGNWFRLSRAWQLTSTAYIFGPAGLSDYLNHQNLFTQPPLQLVTRFKIQRKPGVMVATKPDEVTVVADDEGPFALFRFTPALPRATLYSNWQVTTNDTDVLGQMLAPTFDPWESVLVDGPAPASGAATGQPAQAATIVSYAPKDIRLSAEAKTPSILLLTDHYDPDWKVFVDGHQDTLLKCDYLLRGVQLAPGSHQIEFKFQPPTGFLGVSVAAVVITLVLLGLLLVGAAKSSASSVPAPVSAPAPAITAPAPKAADKAGRRDVRKKAAGNRGPKN